MVQVGVTPRKQLKERERSGGPKQQDKRRGKPERCLNSAGGVHNNRPETAQRHPSTPHGVMQPSSARNRHTRELYKSSVQLLNNRRQRP